MTVQHLELAAGRWRELSFVEQMAHIGGEVERALNWRAKGHPAYAQQACDRALELAALALDAAATFPQRKELARLREALVDSLWGSNEYQSTDTAWRRYFLPFTYAARRHR